MAVGGCRRYRVALYRRRVAAAVAVHGLLSPHAYRDAPDAAALAA